MLSLIIPVYNEEGAVEDIIRRCDSALRKDGSSIRLYEIIVVDDGSSDATPGILKKIDLPSLRVIRHSKNTGNGAAIMTGIEHAKGEWIATIDADDTYRPEDIPRLFENVQAAHADMIVGKRRFEEEGGILTSARYILCAFASLCSHRSVQDVNSGLRIVRKDLIERFVPLYPDRFSLHTVLTVCAGLSKAHILYEPISYGPRIGASKLSPGLKGPFNFLKFLCLIPWAASRKNHIQTSNNVFINY